MSPGPEMVVLAHLLRPQGRRGELLAELLTDFPERFASREGLSLRAANGISRPVTVEAHWLPVGRNAGRVVLKLAEVDSIEAAEALSGQEIVTPATSRTPLDSEEDEQYIADLLGCLVLDHGREVGTIEDIHFPTTATGARLPDAAPLLVVRAAEGEELLIPFARSWVEELSVAAKRLRMTLPEGLLEINRHLKSGS